MKKIISFISGIFMAPFAYAQSSGGTVSLPTNILTSASAVSGLFCGVLLWMFWGLIILGIAMVLIGGYTYATSGGDSEKVSRATKTLTYAAIALVVAIIARGVPLLVSSFIGGPTLTVCGS
jgi:hypothetical protein